MALMMKNAATGRVVGEMAKQTGETIADAVRIAAEERLARLPEPMRRGSVDHEKLERILAEFRANRIDDPRTNDEIIGYDENGLPT